MNFSNSKSNATLTESLIPDSSIDTESLGINEAADYTISFLVKRNGGEKYTCGDYIIERQENKWYRKVGCTLLSPLKCCFGSCASPQSCTRECCGDGWKSPDLMVKAKVCAWFTTQTTRGDIYFEPEDEDDVYTRARINSRNGPFVEIRELDNDPEDVADHREHNGPKRCVVPIPGENYKKYKLAGANIEIFEHCLPKRRI